MYDYILYFEARKGFPGYRYKSQEAMFPNFFRTILLTISTDMQSWSKLNNTMEETTTKVGNGSVH